MKRFSKAKQSGFTLVEIAIVLVIIGLLLAGVLKGQELIENSKIKSIVNDMKAVQAAYNGYLDRYKAIPGDETLATAAARGWGASAAGGGGNANGAGLPKHAGGGVMGVTSDPAGAYGQTGVAVCVAGLTTKQAAGVDTLVDGALPATQIGNNLGSVRGAAGAANPLVPTAAVPAGTAYNETLANTWTICMKI